MAPYPKSQLELLFDQATEQVLANKWKTVLAAKSWHELLPCPDLSGIVYFGAYNGGLTLPHSTLREKQLTWQNWAMSFHNWAKSKLIEQLRNFDRHLEAELNAWNRNHPEKNEQLDFSHTRHQWLDSVDDVSLSDFRGHICDAWYTGKFVRPKFDALKAKYAMGQDPSVKKHLPPTIFIPLAAREGLMATLTPYIDEADLDRLRSAIDGQSVVKQIECNCRQVVLGYIFYQCIQSQNITAYATHVTKWLCYTFQIKSEGNTKNITYSVMLNYLKGKGFAKEK